MSGSVWYISVSKKKLEFKKYPSKQKKKKSSKNKYKKSKNFTLFLMLVASLVLFSNLVSAVSINDTFHINLQTTYANGSIETGTFTFAFNITESSSSSCLGPIVYNHSTSKTTDSRGIVSLYLPTTGSGGGNLSALNFDKQYYLCYYRDGTLKDVSQLGRVPYAFRATQVNLSEVSIDSNLNMTDYNITDVKYCFFQFLGSLVNRITNLFVQDVDVSGDIDVTGNVTASWFIGNINASDVQNNNWIEDSQESSLNVNSSNYWDNYDTPSEITSGDSQLLDGYNSSFFMPLNKSVYGDFDFNGGWMNDGLTISGGDIYAQTAYLYNITSLNVTKQNLTVIDDLIVYGNTELKKNLSVDTDTLFVNSNTKRVGIGTTSPTTKLDVNGGARISGALSSEASYDPTDDGLVFHAPFSEGTGTEIKDRSKSGISGTVNGGAAWTTGKFGNALNFDGSNDYVDCGNDSSLNPTEELTISAWVKLGTFDGGYMAIAAKDQTDIAYWFGLRQTTGVPELILSPDGSNYNESYGATSLADGVWYHVAGVYNGTHMLVYLNGILDENGAIFNDTATTEIYTSSGRLRISGSDDWSGNDFNGTIDEFRVYNRSLSADEIRDYYLRDIGSHGNRD
jgi:hypothetical protein